MKTPTQTVLLLLLAGDSCPPDQSHLHWQWSTCICCPPSNQTASHTDSATNYRLQLILPLPSRDSTAHVIKFAHFRLLFLVIFVFLVIFYSLSLSGAEQRSNSSLFESWFLSSGRPPALGSFFIVSVALDSCFMTMAVVKVSTGDPQAMTGSTYSVSKLQDSHNYFGSVPRKNTQ